MRASMSRPADTWRCYTTRTPCTVNTLPATLPGSSSGGGRDPARAAHLGRHGAAVAQCCALSRATPRAERSSGAPVRTERSGNAPVSVRRLSPRSCIEYFLTRRSTRDRQAGSLLDTLRAVAHGVDRGRGVPNRHMPIASLGHAQTTPSAAATSYHDHHTSGAQAYSRATTAITATPAQLPSAVLITARQPRPNPAKHLLAIPTFAPHPGAKIIHRPRPALDPISRAPGTCSPTSVDSPVRSSTRDYFARLRCKRAMRLASCAKPTHIVLHHPVRASSKLV